jgi:hypothetical protein
MLGQRAHKIAVVIAFVLLTAWLLVGTWQSSRHQSATTETVPDKLTDWLLVTLNFFLVASTLLLWRANNRSAAIAERALTELERPYLFILDYNWLLAQKAQADGHEYGVCYSVMNGGKLPAFVKAVKSGLLFGEAIPLMKDEPQIHELLTAPLIAGGEKHSVTQGFVDDAEDDPAQQHEIRGGKALIPAIAFKTSRVIAKISIEYDGPTTAGHVTTACWEWHPVKYAFTEYGGSEHNQRT